MEITMQEVEKVAKLARLEVSPAEKEAFAKQLSQILTHVETLKQYDTTGIEPTATVLGTGQCVPGGHRPAVVACREGAGECARA